MASGAQASRVGLTFRLDFSWIPAGALLVWWMATSTLPNSLPQESTLICWLIASLLTVGYLASVSGLVPAGTKWPKITFSFNPTK